MDRVLFSVLRVVWMDRSKFLAWGKQDRRGRKIASQKKQVRERDNKAVEHIVQLMDNRSGRPSDYPDSDITRFVNAVFDEANRYGWSVDPSMADEWDMTGNVKNNGPASPTCFVESEEAVTRAGMLSVPIEELAGRHFHLLKTTPQNVTHQVHINAREKYRAEILRTVCREVTADFRISMITVAIPGYKRNDGITIHCPNNGAVRSIMRDLGNYLHDNKSKLQPTVLSLTIPDQHLKGVSYSMRPSNFFVTRTADVGMETKYRTYQDFLTLRAGLIFSALRDSAPSFFNMRSSSHNFGKFKRCVEEYFVAAGLDPNDPSKQADPRALDAKAARQRRKELAAQQTTSCWSRKKSAASKGANAGQNAFQHGRQKVDRAFGAALH